MLKTNWLLLLLFSGISLQAQTLLTHREFQTVPTPWTKEYSSLPPSGNTAIGTEIARALSSYFLKYSQQSQFVRLFLFFSEEGKIDYLVHQSSGDIPADTINRIFNTHVREFITSFSMKGINEKKQLSLFLRTEGTSLGHTQQKASLEPGTLNSLQALKSATQPDGITKIDLSGLALTEIPEEIYRYKSLKELVLTGNQLKHVALDCRKLPNLSTLVLNANPLDRIRLIRPKKLEKLNLQRTQLVRVPASIKRAKNLNSLWLGYNPQIDLKSRDYRRMKSVSDLNLYACALKTLAPSICRLEKLQVLDLYHNELEQLPESLTRLKNLTHLAISNNRLLKLPDNLGQLAKLHVPVRASQPTLVSA
jgi:hypothetical protein